VTAWWRHHFDDGWFRLHRDLFPARRSRREAGAILDFLGLPVGSRVLDAPCGWGRHAVPFLEAGLRPVGADLSVVLLRRARELCADALACPPLAAADLAALPFADGAFDAAVDVFTSVGIFDDDAREVAALAELRRVTRPGGQLLLESAHRDDVVRHFAARDGFRLRDGTLVRIRRRLDAERGVADERWRWRAPDGREGRSRHALRVYTAGEILRLVEAGGWEAEATAGDWDGAPFSHESPRLIVLARRR